MSTRDAQGVYRRQPTAPIFVIALTRTPSGLFALFEHRDGRIWQAWARRPTVAAYGGNRSDEFLLSFSTAGCRVYHFIAEDVPAVNQVVLRFANAPLPVYSRLVADAHSTGDHPIAGRVCVVRVDAQLEDGIGHEAVVRLGRYAPDKIVLFPTAAELFGLLESLVSDEASQVLIDASINVLALTSRQQRLLSLTPDPVHPYVLAASQILHDILGERACAHVSSDHAATATGFTQSRPAREARVIELKEVE